MEQVERSARTRWTRKAILVATAVLAWNGCGKVSAGGGSGETHFLGSCDGVCGAGLSCLCRVCSRACVADSDCDGLASGARCLTADCDSSMMCDVPCTTDAECASFGDAYRCTEGRCRQAASQSDAGDDLCMTSDGTRITCDFAQCAIPPLSTCSFADTCAAFNCGGLEFDENGCRRADCQTDDDCAADERCTLTTLNNLSCEYQNDQCQCGGPLGLLTGTLCDPETIAGPRGEFQELEVVQGAGPCPPGETCVWSWIVTPDGHVDFSKNGVAGSADLNDADLQTVLSLVNGVDLRLAIRDGISCDPPPTDVGVTFRLHLSTETLERDATGCAISGPAGNVFEQLFDLVQRY